MTVEAQASPAQATEPWRAMVSMVLARRDQPGSGAFRSDVRRGIYAHSQHWALPHVAGYATTPFELPPLLRAAAITAEHLRAPQDNAERARLGHALRELHRRRNGTPPNGVLNSMSRRVTILPSLPLEQAAQSLDSLVAFCAAERVPVNFYDLTKVLLRWGRGLSPASVAVRQAVITDFYSTSK